MPCIEYIRHRFNSESRIILGRVQAIIEEYAAAGLSLTVRQVFYQLVSRGFLPNTMKNYKRIVSLMTHAREAGILDWDAISDRTRFLRQLSYWPTPEAIMADVASQFRIDKWANQEYRPIVMVEKDALIDIFERACQSLDVPVLSCRGYLSASEAWSEAQLMRGHFDNGQTPIVLHFGDHDPSGIDMTRDITERLRLYGDADLEVRRIALTMAQVKKYNPPSNPAKSKDQRYAGYVAEHGTSSWELDALDPKVLHKLIVDSIQEYNDPDEFAAVQKEEEKHRKSLSCVVDHWDVALKASKRADKPRPKRKKRVKRSQG